jgi:hypothetical protein
VLEHAAEEEAGHLGELRRAVGSWKTLVPLSSESVKWWWWPLAVTPVNGLGMKVGSRPCLRPTAAQTWR